MASGSIGPPLSGIERRSTLAPRSALTSHAWRRRAASQPQAGGIQPLASSQEEVEHFLATELDIPPPRVQKLLSKNPSLGRASINADLAPNLSAIRCLGAKPALVRRMAVRAPELLTTALRPWVDFLTSYGLQPRSVLDIFEHHPDLIVQRSIYSAGNVLLYLNALGLPHRVILNLVLLRSPELLARDVDSEIGPVIAHLRDLLGDDHRVTEVVSRAPGFLRFDYEQRLAPVLAFLRVLGLRDEEVKSIVRECISVVLADVDEGLKPTVAFLASLGLDAKQVNAVLVGCPRIFEFTTSSLQRKWNFLVDDMDGGIRDVVSFPKFFCKSLLREIGPRHSYVMTHNHLKDVSSPLFTRVGDIDLAELLECNDTEFCAKVKCSEYDFLLFQAKWINEAGLKLSRMRAMAWSFE